MKSIIIALGAIAVAAVAPASARAYCRVPTPVWDDAHPIRIVLHDRLNQGPRFSIRLGTVEA